jgi:CDGSH-type Zn-finger protein
MKQINPDAVFGIISSGTRNVLVKSLDLPSETFECCKHYGASKLQKKIDVISATVTSFPDNGDDASSSNSSSSKLAPTRIFLNAAELGVGAEIIDRSKKIRDKVKSRIVSTVSSVVATLPTYESNLCEYMSSSSSLEPNSSSNITSTDTDDATDSSSSIIKKEKPKIMPLPNGPYYLLNDMPKIVENLQNSKGKPLSTVAGVALCRCGASKNKPFCDGTHATIGFSSENKGIEKDGSGEEKNKVIKDKRKDYVGKKITVHDNRRICSHAAECVNNLPSVFRLNTRPWIDPEGANVEEIINTIRKCPSGALSYSIDGIEHRDQNETAPMVTVSKDGPYLITGGIELIGGDANNTIQFGDGASKEHYTLCRCGVSNNKPFCDGMHKVINFKDDKN